MYCDIICSDALLRRSHFAEGDVRRATARRALHAHRAAARRRGDFVPPHAPCARARERARRGGEGQGRERVSGSLRTCRERLNSR
jgi:hypothetical protein